MEELRSTEVLDKEIQSDARKKAEKVLTASDADSQKIVSDVEKRLAASSKERSEFYEKKLLQHTHDEDASLPLEKQRYLVSYIGKSVSEAIDAYLKTLSEEKRFSLIESLFKRYKSCIKGKKMTALVYGFDVSRAKKYLASVLGSDLLSCNETTFEKTDQQEINGITVHEGIILEAEDKSVRCRLTLEELISEIEGSRSAQLAETLFGGRLPE